MSDNPEQEQDRDHPEGADGDDRPDPPDQDVPDPLDDQQIDEILEEYSDQGDLTDLEDDVELEGGTIYSTFRLPGFGFWDRHGHHHDTVRIHAMSGKSDLTLAPDARKDPGPEEIEEVVIDCTDRLGDLTDDDKIAEAIRNDLLVFDYYHIIFRLRQLSVGDQFEFDYECEREGCDGSGTKVVSLADVNYWLPTPPTPENREGLEMDLDFRGLEFTFRWHWYTQSDAQYIRRIRSYLQDRLEDRKRKRRRGQDTTSEDEELDLSLIDMGLLSRVDAVEMPNGREVTLGRSHKRRSGEDTHMLDSLEVIRELPSGVRMMAFQQFDEIEPSHDTTVYYDCTRCGHEMSVALYPLDPNFFFPSAINVG